VRLRASTPHLLAISPAPKTCEVLRFLLRQPRLTRLPFAPAQLTMEVITQLSRMFQPDPRMIKKQIESLIDREYLERDSVRSHSCLLFSSCDCFALQRAWHMHSSAHADKAELVMLRCTRSFFVELSAPSNAGVPLKCATVRLAGEAEHFQVHGMSRGCARQAGMRQQAVTGCSASRV